jgi:SAM-dependent methyltransferase
VVKISLEEKEKILGTTITNYQCEICTNTENNCILKVREMYFGTREVFNYLQCSNCGCLQILNPPEDYSKHYPPNYFTYLQNHESKLKARLNYFRDRAAMGEASWLGNMLLKKFGEPTYVTRVKRANVTLKDSILDVGCGRGILLHKMKESGFENVLGVDPFITESISYKNGLKILKQDFHNLNGKYDFIMFNHSFEHMSNPLAVMKKSNELLIDNKFLLIRIPVCDSYAFNHYKTNWSSLDAPRHLFLHTKKSIQRLADDAGFKIESISYDSRSWQLWGSEQYSKDIALIDDNSYYVNLAKSIFSSQMIEEFEKLTIELNKSGEGDQAEFYLRKVEQL